MKEKGKIKKVEISKEEINEGMKEYNKKQKWKEVTKTKQKRDKKKGKVKLRKSYKWVVTVQKHYIRVSFCGEILNDIGRINIT